MTPKSLLRHKLVVSDAAEFTGGASFHRVLRDLAETRPGISLPLAKDRDIERVILCSGKVYYDLFDEREKRGLKNVQILRIEQLYPFPSDALLKELTRFPNARVIWCQEEPRNMGAWSFVDPQIEWILTKLKADQTRPQYAGRQADVQRHLVGFQRTERIVGIHRLAWLLQPFGESSLGDRFAQHGHAYFNTHRQFL